MRVNEDIRPVGRAQLRKRAKADTILQAARELFLEHGYSGATTDMIQGRAAVSKSTLYSHFPTKEVLFEAVCKLGSDAFEAMLANAVVSETEPRGFLHRFGTEFLTYLLSEEGKAFFRLMVEASKNFPQLGPIFYGAGIKASNDMIERYLADAHAAKRLVIDDPALSSEHYMGMLRGDMHLRVILNIGTPPSPAQIDTYVAATVDRFLKAHSA
ncbi:TetR/AcrR family transcriptional regulator [Sphingomonas montanisoli]|uniref:TetR/AcrR family transcriptional regulator n=1 Tax=Sphingomonas montanisoli TaxID=2606412 RepID=UPI0015E1806B|nr:TetR/AcrR family transcriptional regulator [Sphingomonas montanisoli]